MAAKSKQPPHFLLIPLMAQGHLIPMADLAKLLAENGGRVSLITTPQNTSRINSLLSHPNQSQIQILHLQFPPQQQSGVPQGCENLDSLPSLSLLPKFLSATSLLCQATEDLFQQLSPRPSCVVSDMALPWTIKVAQKFNVPRLVFYSLCSLYLLSMANLRATGVIEKIMSASDSELIAMPNLPDKVEFTKPQIICTLDAEFMEWANETGKADQASYGIILNSFDALEPKYLEEFKKATGSDKVWCVGPVSLCNRDTADKAVRGNKAAIDEHECLKWLDRQQPGSVIYAALGSLCNIVAAQIIELGLSLEASNRPFIWVIRQTEATKNELEKWLSESGFEERTKERGLVVRGWAPQVLILSHPAAGAFVTHCGWNSTIEGITAGVPMVAWPLFGDQIFNERLIVQLLKVGVSVGVEKSVVWGGEEEIGVQVKMEAIRDAIEKVMDGEGNMEMRRRVRDLAERAKAAMEDGGSSNLNLKRLIEDITHQAEVPEAHK
ncbi:UDP-glycosyltransferase 73C4-like [Cucurbita pepo subsp. pepo]|uniref:UDP-glycosyltransferase 73C4-like n=1 Tax=Cucurbita pepo subsp. pepo TaxID=3664 RepID=UPI000C9D846C|nr:UDP-glycosyltransferase 73C4-like [Cucurbita pepo subsp. pepo]